MGHGVHYGISNHMICMKRKVFVPDIPFSREWLIIVSQATLASVVDQGARDIQYLPAALQYSNAELHILFVHKKSRIEATGEN